MGGFATSPVIEEMLITCPRAARTHAGQHGLDHRDDAEVVRVEERADLVVLAFLDGRHVAVAGVVHEHVDAAEGALRLATAASICARFVTSSASAIARSGCARDDVLDRLAARAR